MTWNRISIHRNYPIKVKGELVLKGEIYVEGHGTSGTPLYSFFLAQMKEGGVFTGDDITPVDIYTSYFQNVIAVRIALPGRIERSVSVSMSGDINYDEYGLKDYYNLDAVVRNYLQTKGELGQSSYNVNGLGQ